MERTTRGNWVVSLPPEFEQFDQRMAERHVAVLAILTEIKTRAQDHGERIRSLERKVAVLGWAYGVGVVILLGIASRFGWSE